MDVDYPVVYDAAMGKGAVLGVLVSLMLPVGASAQTRHHRHHARHHHTHAHNAALLRRDGIAPFASEAEEEAWWATATEAEETAVEEYSRVQLEQALREYPPGPDEPI